MSGRRTAIKHRARALWVATCVVTLALSPAVAAERGSLERRVAELERLYGTNSLLELLERVERLSREVRELRGEVEVQSHALGQLKAQQRELYLDLDRRLAGRTATGQSGDGSDAAPAEQPVPEVPAEAQMEEQASYKKALRLLDEREYRKAGEAFTAFLTRFPRGVYADNAQYWLGESYYVRRDFKPALQAFEKLLGKFPNSGKRCHAMLKVGYIHDEQRRRDEAVKTLGEVERQCANSSAAGLAADRIAQIRRRRR